MKEPSREIMDMFLKTGPVFILIWLILKVFSKAVLFRFVTCPLDPISNANIYVPLCLV